MDLKSRAKSLTSLLCCSWIAAAIQENVTSIKGVSVVFYLKYCGINKGDSFWSVKLSLF